MNTADRRIAEVERYIHELAIALSGLPADEREDVIAGIREHIDDSLLAIADPAPADVQRVLDDLGDPLAIAADAGAPASSATRRPEPATTSVQPTRPEETADASAARRHSTNAPLLEREWVPMALIGSFVLAGLSVFAVGTITVFALGLWLLGITILVASPLWRAFEKLVGVAVFVLVPAVMLLAGRSYARWWELASDLPGPSLERIFPSAFGFGPAIDGLLIAGIGLLTLGIVGAWLLYRGSVRARR